MIHSLRIAGLLALAAALLSGCSNSSASTDNPEARKAFMGGTPPPDVAAKIQAAQNAGAQAGNNPRGQ